MSNFHGEVVMKGPHTRPRLAGVLSPVGGSQGFQAGSPSSCVRVGNADVIDVCQQEEASRGNITGPEKFWCISTGGRCDRPCPCVARAALGEKSFRS